jgi:hypothetical protein
LNVLLWIKARLRRKTGCHPRSVNISKRITNFETQHHADYQLRRMAMMKEDMIEGASSGLLDHVRGHLSRVST